MSVTIASAYDPFDPVEAAITPKKAVKASALLPLGQNHNFVHATLTGPVVEQCWARGISVSTDSDEDLAVWKTGRHMDGRGLRFRIRAKHSGSGGDGTLKIVVSDGSTSYNGTATVLSTDTTFTTYSIDVASPTAAALTIVLSCDEDAVTVQSISGWWQHQTGSISDAKQASGFQWAQPSERGPHRPLTDEWVTRVLKGPRLCVQDTPMSVVSASDNVNGGLVGGYHHDWTTTSTVYDTVLRFPVIWRYKTRVTWYALLTGPGPSTTKVEIRDSVNGVVELVAQATSLSLGTYTYSDETMIVEPGLSMITIQLKAGSAGTARLYSLCCVQQGVLI